MTDPELLGATVAGSSTRFVVASSVAERIELCLFGTDPREQGRVDLHHGDDGCWRVEVSGVGDGQRYGFRVHGPGDLAAGHACDPAKLLIDPAARRVAGSLRWTPELVAPGVDSAPFVPRSVVVTSAGPLAGRRPETPWDRTVVYEAHVGHLTARHPLVAADDRGRYRGLAAPAVVEHLQHLGVTAVELLPVQHFVSERDLVAAGKANVWGYNPLAWGAPHSAYASSGGNPVAELRAAVERLHEAGIEVWLDVVFNHTCEGALGEGPILSWRGLDNAATYRLRAGPGGLVDDDVTGCGNAVDARSPLVRRLIRECLVRWVVELGIDGFRFDLAATLARGDDGPSGDAPLIAELAAEPLLSDTKLVAEPWDLGGDGYALGRFPVPWREWNDRFRDDVRDVWRGAANRRPLGPRLTGSAELLRHDGRDAAAGVNAIATHDGFTLADLVSYERPTDGGHGQRSSNGGEEGPTNDATVRSARARRQRSLLGSVLCSQGVPMLLAGDELGRSQAGQANGYTLDPEAWGLPWADGDRDLVDWVAAAVDLRRREPALRRSAWVDPGDPWVRWREVGGSEMTEADWAAEVPSLQVELDGTDLGGARLLVLVAPGPDRVTFGLPAGVWRVELDATWDRPPRAGDRALVADRLAVDTPAFVVLHAWSA